MSDLSDYVRKGDLAAPFVRTRKAERAQEQAQDLDNWVQEVVAKALPLSPEARDQIADLLRPYANVPKPAQMKVASSALLRRRG
jgi:hypothetical protein